MEGNRGRKGKKKGNSLIRGEDELNDWSRVNK